MSSVLKLEYLSNEESFVTKFQLFLLFIKTFLLAVLP